MSGTRLWNKENDFLSTFFRGGLSLYAVDTIRWRGAICVWSADLKANERVTISPSGQRDAMCGGVVLPVTSNGMVWHWSGTSVLHRKTDPPLTTPGCSVCAVGAPTSNLLIRGKNKNNKSLASHADEKPSDN